ncbi:MAG: hypothetical protein ACP5HQ_08945 [Thermoprotei archaeon]
MDAYEFVYYLLKHAVPNSTAGFSANSRPFILMKEDQSTVKLVFCETGEVVEKRFKFGEDNVNRVANEIVNFVSEVVGAEVKEVNMLKSVDFSDCVKLEETKPRQRARVKRQEDVQSLIESLRKSVTEYSFVPLFSHEGEVIGLIPEVFSLGEGTHKEPVRVTARGVTKLALDPATWVRYVGYLKADRTKGNPLLNYAGMTVFSALFVDKESLSVQGEWKSRTIPKKVGTFFLLNRRGKIHSEELEFLDYSPLQKGKLSYGLFLKDGETLVRLGGGLMTSSSLLVDYLMGSLFLPFKGEVAVDVLREVADFMTNNVVSKTMPSKELKEFIILSSNPSYSNVVKAFDNARAVIRDPIEYWTCEVIGNCGGQGIESASVAFAKVTEALLRTNEFRLVLL